jgi:arsenate reductase
VFLGKARRLHWPIPTRLPREEMLGALPHRARPDPGALEVLEALIDLPGGAAGRAEFHASVRVKDLATSTRFYAWLLGAEPKEWTHRYATFVRPELHTNFVLVVSDGKSCTTTRSITSASPWPTRPRSSRVRTREAVAARKP